MTRYRLLRRSQCSAGSALSLRHVAPARQVTLPPTLTLSPVAELLARPLLRRWRFLRYSARSLVPSLRSGCGQLRQALRSHRYSGARALRRLRFLRFSTLRRHVAPTLRFLRNSAYYVVSLPTSLRSHRRCVRIAYSVASSLRRFAFYAPRPLRGYRSLPRTPLTCRLSTAYSTTTPPPQTPSLHCYVAPTLTLSPHSAYSTGLPGGTSLRRSRSPKRRTTHRVVRTPVRSSYLRPTSVEALPTVGGWSEGHLARPCSTDSHSARDAPESILRLLRARSSPHWFARLLARPLLRRWRFLRYSARSLVSLPPTLALSPVALGLARPLLRRWRFLRYSARSLVPSLRSGAVCRT